MSQPAVSTEYEKYAERVRYEQMIYLWHIIRQPEIKDLAVEA
jgi:hypothetical protein